MQIQSESPGTTAAELSGPGRLGGARPGPGPRGDYSMGNREEQTGARGTMGKGPGDGKRALSDPVLDFGTEGRSMLQWNTVERSHSLAECARLENA